MSDILPIGCELFEYRIRQVLGRGGFGVTYLAEDNNLGFLVAIKEYFPPGLAIRNGLSIVAAKNESDPDGEMFAWGRQRFLDEGRTLARFKHSNIVRVSRLMEVNDSAYLVMDFEQGRDFGRHITGLGRPSEERELRALIIPLLDGLALVHHAGFLHRDIKPANILVRDQDISPVLLDFGSARTAVGARKAGFTVLVSPGFTPVEQYDQEAEQGAWTDIYALGAVLYWAIGQTKPLDALARSFGAPMKSAVELGGSRYSPGFLRAVDWALAIEPKERPRDIREWRAALLGADPEEITGKRRPDGAPAGDQVVVPARSDTSADRGDYGSVIALSHGDRQVVHDLATRELQIGRGAGCDIIVADRVASRNHATIRVRGTEIELTDTSKWGTFIDGDDGSSRRAHQSTVILPPSGQLGLGRRPEEGDFALAIRFHRVSADDGEG